MTVRVELTEQEVAAALREYASRKSGVSFNSSVVPAYEFNDYRRLVDFKNAYRPVRKVTFTGHIVP